MVDKIDVIRQPAGVEDLALGMSTQNQTRSGSSVVVTELNASNIPYDATRKLDEVAGGVHITANDTTANVLSAKLTTDGTIVLTVQNPGANETLEISVKTGITANDILQLDSSGRLPAVDGSLLVGLPSGVNTHIALLDTPNAFVANNFQVVNPAGTALIHITPATLLVAIGALSASSVHTLTNKSIDGAGNTVTNLPTTALADNIVTLAKMADLAEGSIIAGNATNDPSIVAPGVEGQVLTQQASGPPVFANSNTVGSKIFLAQNYI